MALYKGIDTKNIRNILTLRYDPNRYSNTLSITSKDVKAINIPHIEEKVEKIIKKSLTNFIESNKPKTVVIGISSGVDSNLVLVLLRELYPEIKIKGLCYGFHGSNNEVKVAEMIASKYNVEFENIILDNYLENIAEQISIIGEPKSNYYWLEMAKKAKKEGDVFLTGDGGDELFGGYTFRYDKFNNLPAKNWIDRVLNYLSCHNRDWVIDQEKIFTKKMNFSWDEIKYELKPFFNNNLDGLTQVLLADYNGKLKRDWIPSHEKIANYLNLNTLSPFLNDELIKLAFTIPTSQKFDISTGVGKLILRDIMRKKGVVLSTEKYGFSPSILDFWNNHGREFVRNYLLNGDVIKDGWINHDWVEGSFVMANNHDIRYISRLLHVTSFEIWYRLFISKTMKPTDKLLQ